MIKPPEALWEPTGQHPSGSTVCLTVRICLDPKGLVWSVHQSSTDKDQELLDTWPGGGARAIAHALLVEALRREAYLCILTGLTRDQEMLTKYMDGTAEGKAAVEQELATACNTTIQTTVPRMSPAVVREILAMVTQSTGTVADNT